MTTRRDFLRLLGGALATTAAGLLVPEAPRRVYSFLRGNPLADPSLQRMATASGDPMVYLRAGLDRLPLGPLSTFKAVTTDAMVASVLGLEREFAREQTLLDAVVYY